VGADEPLRVRGAQLIVGSLPGTPPIASTIDAGGDAGAAKPQGLVVTDVESLNPVVQPGQAGKKFSGRTSDSATAVAVRLLDLGSAYWVLPLGAADPQFPGELTFEVNAEFSATIPPGTHLLRFVALDASGGAGAQTDLALCFASKVPDNLHACDPKAMPPEAVFALSWDADADLDLTVVAPDGRVVDPRHPTSVAIDGGRPGPEVGVIDRDSLGACVPDGIREENLVWQKRPTGTWQIYANLFDACRKPGARFTVVVYEAQGDGDARVLVETYRKSGRLIDLDANGGGALGLFVVEYPF
jgi:hypothetical protein